MSKYVKICQNMSTLLPVFAFFSPWSPLTQPSASSLRLASLASCPEKMLRPSKKGPQTNSAKYPSNRTTNGGNATKGREHPFNMQPSKVLPLRACHFLCAELLTARPELRSRQFQSAHFRPVESLGLPFLRRPFWGQSHRRPSMECP